MAWPIPAVQKARRALTPATTTPIASESATRGGLDEKGKPADTRTPAQKASLEDLLYSLVLDYPDAEILGHRDLPWVRKSCPCFDVKEWLKQIDFHL